MKTEEICTLKNLVLENSHELWLKHVGVLIQTALLLFLFKTTASESPVLLYSEQLCILLLPSEFRFLKKSIFAYLKKQISVLNYILPQWMTYDTVCLAFWVNSLGCSWMERPTMWEFCLGLRETASLGTHTGVTSTLVVNNSIVTSFCNGNGK